METNTPAIPEFTHPTRQRIYDYVTEQPGVHMRELTRALGIPLSTLEYHLHRMELKKKLVTRRLRNYKSYFPPDGLGRADRDYLYFLRQEMPRRIALRIHEEPGVSFRDLSEALPVTPSTVSFHLRKLVDAGIVEEEEVGRRKMYGLADPRRVVRLTAEYRPTFADRTADRFSEAWMDVRP